MSTPAPRTTPSPTLPTNPSTPTRLPNQQNREDLVVRGGFISGSVLLDDGTPPPQSIVIEKVCGPRRSPVAYTDRKGHFSFQVSGGNSILPDASESSNSGFGQNAMRTTSQTNDTNLMECELIAVLPGFRSETVYLGMRRGLDNPDIGVILLHRIANVPGTTISATLLNAPKDARKAYDKGLTEARNGKYEAAMKSFQKAVDQHPTFANAWYELGHLRAMTNAPEAQAAFQHAMQSDAKYVNPYVDMAFLEIKGTHWKEAEEIADKGIHLDPVDFPQLFFYKGIAEFNLQRAGEAEKSARQAAHLDTAHRFPKIEQLLATVLVEKHDYAGAAEHMREYLKRAPDASDAEQSRKQLAEIEKAVLAAKN